MFYLGFAGMPRRVHDYPFVFMGWNSVASGGHFITMSGILFFFIMFLDTHLERRSAVYHSLGIPRWHKRINYYSYKIRFLQHFSKNINSAQKHFTLVERSILVSTGIICIK